MPQGGPVNENEETVTTTTPTGEKVQVPVSEVSPGPSKGDRTKQDKKKRKTGGGSRGGGRSRRKSKGSFYVVTKTGGIQKFEDTPRMRKLVKKDLGPGKEFRETAKTKKAAQKKAKKGKTFIAKGKKGKVKQVAGTTKKGKQFKIEGERAKDLSKRISKADRFAIGVKETKKDIGIKQARQRGIITKKQAKLARRRDITNIPVTGQRIRFKGVKDRKPQTRTENLGKIKTKVPEPRGQGPITGPSLTSQTFGPDTRERKKVTTGTLRGKDYIKTKAKGDILTRTATGISSTLEAFAGGAREESRKSVTQTPFVTEQKAPEDISTLSRQDLKSQDLLAKGSAVLDEAVAMGKGVALGVGFEISEGISFATNLATKPVETIERTGSGLVSVATDPLGTAGRISRSISKSFGTTTGRGAFLGRAATIVGGGKAIGKGISAIKSSRFATKITKSRVFTTADEAFGEAAAVAKSGTRTFASKVKSRINIIDDDLAKSAQQIETFRVKGDDLYKVGDTAGVGVTRKLKPTQTGPFIRKTLKSSNFDEFLTVTGGKTTGDFGDSTFATVQRQAKIIEGPGDDVIYSPAFDTFFDVKSKQVIEGPGVSAATRKGFFKKPRITKGDSVTDIFRIEKPGGGDDVTKFTDGGGLDLKTTEKLSETKTQTLFQQSELAKQQAKETATSALRADIEKTSTIKSVGGLTASQFPESQAIEKPKGGPDTGVKARGFSDTARNKRTQQITQTDIFTPTKLSPDFSLDKTSSFAPITSSRFVSGQRSGQAQKQKQISATKRRTRPRLGAQTRQAGELRSLTALNFAQAQKTKTFQGLRPALVPTLQTRAGFKAPSFDFPAPGGFLGTTEPFAKRRQAKKTKKKKKRDRKFRFQPSLVGIELGKSIKRAPKGARTGLGIRPTVNKNKGKKLMGDIL